MSADRGDVITQVVAEMQRYATVVDACHQGVPALLVLKWADALSARDGITQVRALVEQWRRFTSGVCARFKGHDQHCRACGYSERAHAARDCADELEIALSALNGSPDEKREKS